MDWLSMLLEQAYAAALDGDLWSSFTDRLVRELASIGGVFIVLDTQRSRPRTSEFAGAFAGLQEEYSAGGWWRYDPQIPRASRLTESGIYSDLSAPGNDTDEARAYRNWELGWGSWHHLTTVNLLDGARNLRGCFSLHYGSDGFSPNALRKLGLLAPSLNRALQLGFRHEETLSQAYWSGLAATDRSHALALLDERGTVMHLTEAAHHLARSNDGLRISHNQLRCDEPSQQERLGAVLDAALAAKPAAGAMRIVRPSMRAPLILTVFPLARIRRALAPFEAAALVRLIDPTGQPYSDRHLYRQAFTLTERETDLALCLMKGHSPETAAIVLGITIATARIHLRRLFHKTGTSRQSDLVRLLAQLR